MLNLLNISNVRLRGVLNPVGNYQFWEKDCSYLEVISTRQMSGSRVRMVQTQNKMKFFRKDKTSIGNTGKFFPEVLRQNLCLTETVYQPLLLGCIVEITGRNSAFCCLGGQVTAEHFGHNWYESINFRQLYQNRNQAQTAANTLTPC